MSASSAQKRHLAPAMLNQLARYAPALSWVERLDDGASSLLEVGSGSEGIARFAASRWQITVCDRDFSDYGSVEVGAAGDDELTRVEADVTELPFADGQFDIVLTLDLLEHVPSQQRAKALSELARVTSNLLVAGCPCGSRALAADRRLARFYRLQRREPPPWLLEHLDNGFPEVDQLTEALAPYGSVTTFPNEQLGMHQLVSAFEGVRGVVRGTVWLARLLEPGLYAEADGRRNWARAVLEALRGWDRGRAYRQFVVLDRSRPAGG